MKPNITFTYGLRYDYVTRAVGDYGFQSGPDMKTGEWLIGTRGDAWGLRRQGRRPACPAPLSQIPFNQFIRATGETNSLLKPITDNWGPRAGVAWQVNDRHGPANGLRADVGLDGVEKPVRPAPVRELGMAAVLGYRHRHHQHRRAEPSSEIEDVDRCRSGATGPHPWNSAGFFNDPDRKNWLLAPVARRAPAGDHARHDRCGRLRRQLQRPDGVCRQGCVAGRARRAIGNGPPVDGRRAGRAASVAAHQRNVHLLRRHRHVAVQRVSAEGAAPLRERSRQQRGLHVVEDPRTRAADGSASRTESAAARWRSELLGHRLECGRSRATTFRTSLPGRRSGSCPLVAASVGSTKA